MNPIRPAGPLRLVFTLAAGLAMSLGATGQAAAQDYPSKPVRIIVPFSAGGGTDVVARALADRASAKWNQSVVVENKPGANTMIAADLVARSPKDGYTLLFTINSHVAKLGGGSRQEIVSKMRCREVSYGSFGVGSFAHLYGEQMQKTGNFKMLHVPYKGESDAVIGLLSGQIDATFLGPQAWARIPEEKATILSGMGVEGGLPGFLAYTSAQSVYLFT